ncbi:MAG: 4-vinyl reductase [Myxococcota bacterium]
MSLGPGRRCHVKGSSIASRIVWVRLSYGEQGLAMLRDQLAPGDTELAELLDSGPDIAAWYDLEHFLVLNEAIDRHFGDGDLALVRELGRHAAEASLTTLFRMFFKSGTVHWILSKASRLWGMHYDSGRLLVREFPGPILEVELEIADFARPHRIHCVSVQGWVERAAELSGVPRASLCEVDCRALGDQRCRFRLKWDPREDLEPPGSPPPGP